MARARARGDRSKRERNFLNAIVFQEATVFHYPPIILERALHLFRTARVLRIRTHFFACRGPNRGFGSDVKSRALLSFGGDAGREGKLKVVGCKRALCHFNFTGKFCRATGVSR